MRILHVVPSYLPAWRYGGPIRSVHGLCKGLHEAGHEVVVYTTNADGDGELQIPVSTPVHVEGVEVWYFPTIFRRLYWSPAMGRALRKNTAGFDVVHLHSIYLWPTLAGARAARRARVPYVLSPRGMLMGELIRGKSRWVKTAWIKLVECKNLASAAAVHFTSEREAREAAALRLSFQRVVIVPNGADDVTERSADGGAGIEMLAIESPYLLFIGRISWEKGLDRAIAALAHAPGVRLVVAGESMGKPSVDELRALASRHGVAPRITFVGEVHGARKAVLMANAAALILPSYSESFGNVVLEAMAAGRPVIVTPEVGAAEVVLSTGSGAVFEADAERMGRGISELLADGPTLYAMGRKGRQAFESTYRWSAVAERMAAAYRDVIAERTASP